MSLTQVNTNPTGVNTIPIRVNTKHHESKTGLDQILLKIYDQLDHKALLFYKVIYFIKHSLLYICFISKRGLKSILKMQEPLIRGEKTKNDFNFKENYHIA